MNVSELYKDVMFYHWREESQHAILDELEWLREDARTGADERDRGVDDLIALVGAVDEILQAQAAADSRYFAVVASGNLGGAKLEAVSATVLKAYRWQFIVSGLKQSRFNAVLANLITPAQQERIGAALAPIMQAFVAH
jgi:hypothetical protein